MDLQSEDHATRRPNSAESAAVVVVKESLDRAVEVARARLTLNIFLALATVTVTGFAIQSHSPKLFFLAALIPVVALCCDLLMKYRYTSIFLYQAACAELAIGQSEPTILMFLDFKRVTHSRYAEILRIEDPAERRIKFRREYVLSGKFPRLLLYGAAVVVELALGYYAVHLFPMVPGSPS